MKDAIVKPRQRAQSAGRPQRRRPKTKDSRQRDAEKRVGSEYAIGGYRERSSGKVEAPEGKICSARAQVANAGA